MIKSVPSSALLERFTAIVGTKNVLRDDADLASRLVENRGLYRGTACRPGYRQHKGYWFPLAAFATGAIIGEAMSQPRDVYRPLLEYRPRPFGLP